MANEQTTNFATSTLTSSLSTTALSFTVTAGQGALFPSSNFLVTIDGEVLLISVRSTDTFTVAATGRGFDGTVADLHSVGATVQQTTVAYTLNRLWQNLPDTYHPDIPPIQVALNTSGVPSGSASTYDNEFEKVGGWTLTPTPASPGLFTVGTSMRSHLLFKAPGDNKTYTAYEPFTPGTTPFTAVMKLSDAVNLPIIGASTTIRTYFFVSDQTNPASPGTSSNFFYIRLDSSAKWKGQGFTLRTIQGATTSAGTFSMFGTLLQLGTCYPVYLRITYDNTTWSAWYGDGWTYNLLSTTTSPTFAPKSLGVQFVNGSFSASPYTAAIDFVRVTVGSVLPPYGQ